jgi:hypothetical protein
LSRRQADSTHALVRGAAGGRAAHLLGRNRKHIGTFFSEFVHIGDTFGTWHPVDGEIVVADANVLSDSLFCRRAAPLETRCARRSHEQAGCFTPLRRYIGPKAPI